MCALPDCQWLPRRRTVSAFGLHCSRFVLVNILGDIHHLRLYFSHTSKCADDQEELERMRQTHEAISASPCWLFRNVLDQPEARFTENI